MEFFCFLVVYVLLYALWYLQNPNPTKKNKNVLYVIFAFLFLFGNDFKKFNWRIISTILMALKAETARLSWLLASFWKKIKTVPLISLLGTPYWERRSSSCAAKRRFATIFVLHLVLIYTCYCYLLVTFVIVSTYCLLAALWNLQPQLQQQAAGPLYFLSTTAGYCAAAALVAKDWQAAALRSGATLLSLFSTTYNYHFFFSTMYIVLLPTGYVALLSLFSTN